MTSTLHIPNSESFQTNWIEEFEKMDNNYELFYRENVSFVSLHSIYIDKDKEIQTVKEEKYFFCDKNFISRDELLGILKKNCFHNNKRYTILSILKYNLDLDPNDVNHFLKSDVDKSYLSVIQNIDKIPFEKTIEMFQDLNSVFFLFYEKTYSDDDRHKNKILTKKIILSQSSTRKKTLRKMV
jgi:hypothetical protein